MLGVHISSSESHIHTHPQQRQQQQHQVLRRKQGKHERGKPEVDLTHEIHFPISLLNVILLSCLCLSAELSEVPRR